MNPDVFFENFELLADAPNGVQKLRELILQLAVMGKLVPQDPNDEPASALIENIKNQKKIRYKENKIKRIKVLPIKNENLPFKLPDKWEFARMGDIAEKLGAGSTPLGGSSVYQESGIKFIRSQNVWNTGLKLENVAYISSEIHERMNGTFVESGDILLNITGASIGRSSLVPDDFDEGNVNQHVAIVRLVDKSICEYLHLCIISPYIQDSIMSEQVGISREGLSMNRLKEFLIPIPPLTEQKRIASKVDELMSLCDNLEARRQKKQEIQSKLNSAALDRMLSAENQDEFEQHWQHICENFDLLYDNPENVEKLRQAILQLAVQGKLVPQNPEDEPASVLIEKIEAAKEKLVREGKSQKVKPLPEICLEELPYDLPDSWIWIRLGNVSNSLRYGTSKKCAYNITGSPVLRIPNIVNGKIDTFDLKFTQLSTKEIEDLRLDFGDLLLVRSNGSTSLVGRSAVINSNLSGYAYAGYLVRLRTFPSCISPDYLHLVLESSYVRDQIEMPIRTTSGVKNINSFEISRLLLPIPPLAEQKRIVEKVEQLMGLCDELESKLRKEQEDSEKLMEAVVKGLLEGAATEKTELEKPIPLQVATIKLK